MTQKALDAYMVRCELLGWEPSWRGAKAFRDQIRDGYRDPITFEFVGKKVG